MKNVRFVTSPVASQLTGLSTGKLREWTSRRALIPVDVRPKTNGSPAKFRWQTLLVLRIAALLRDGFGLELHAHRESFAKLGRVLRKRSFANLWGRKLALSTAGTWKIVGQNALLPRRDVVLLELDPHLEVLRQAFALPGRGAAVAQGHRPRSSGPRRATRVPSRDESDADQSKRSA